MDSFDEIVINKIDLIKIDVEMHEPEAIEGMIDILKRDRPFILIEILTVEIANKILNSKDLEKLYETAA